MPAARPTKFYYADRAERIKPDVSFPRAPRTAVFHSFSGRSWHGNAGSPAKEEYKEDEGVVVRYRSEIKRLSFIQESLRFPCFPPSSRSCIARLQARFSGNIHVPEMGIFEHGPVPQGRFGWVIMF